MGSQLRSGRPRDPAAISAWRSRDGTRDRARTHQAFWVTELPELASAFACAMCFGVPSFRGAPANHSDPAARPSVLLKQDGGIIEAERIISFRGESNFGTDFSIFCPSHKPAVTLLFRYANGLREIS